MKSILHTSKSARVLVAMLLAMIILHSSTSSAQEATLATFALVQRVPSVLNSSGEMRLNPQGPTATDVLTQRVAPASTSTAVVEETVDVTVTEEPASTPTTTEVTSPTRSARRGATAPTVEPASPTAAKTVVTTEVVETAESTVKTGDGIRLNFQGAALSDVLNYLSEAAGFVIVQEAPVSGTVNVVSRQSLTPDEAVNLVNAVLVEKGYVAIRNGRILKIVSRKDAQKRDLPVETGSDPETIPRRDDIVTQILPLRYSDAVKLVENLRPLLAESANITANESSNTILLTDTQTNIRRVAQIIRAIDTSVSGISSIRVYPLQFADAKELANVITQLFAVSQTSRNNPPGGDAGRGGFPDFGRGGSDRDRRGGTPSTGQSEARAAAARIIAVADEQSNSVIVSAPDDVLPIITDIVTRIDTNITEVTDTRIFRLLHADATETAEIINELYSQTAGQAGQAAQNRRGDNNAGRGSNNLPPWMQGNQGNQGAASSQRSERALLQTQVVAVGDPRTNSLVITAARETMTQIAELVGRLDSTDAKKQRVYVHSLEHADAESVATVLRGMLGGPTAAGTQTTSSRLTERSTTGASIDSTDSNSGGGTTGRGVR